MTSSSIDTSKTEEVASGYAGRSGSSKEPQDGFNLSRDFYAAYKEYKDWEKNAGDSTKAKELVEKFNRIVIAVRELSIISPNEELDDINTTDLKYFIVPFCMGDVCRCTTGVEGRKKMLEDGLVFYAHFMELMLKLKVCTEEEYDLFSQKKSLNGNQLRDVKIERFKQGKELDRKLSILFKRKADTDDEEFAWGSGGSLDEEDVRELVIALLKRGVLTVLDESKFMNEEIPLLEMMENKVPVPAKPEKPKEPWILKLQDKAALHLYWKDRVLKPFHNLPTMTLQEWAEWEMENAIHGAI